MPYYAVANGREKGIFNTWAECEQQVKGFKGAAFKKFKTLTEARSFIQQIASTSKNKETNESESFSGVVQAARRGNTSIKKEVEESNDFIPLDNPKAGLIVVKQEIKKESPEESLFFEDVEGDKDLLLALSVLKEYPDTNKTKSANNKKSTTSTQNKLIRIGHYNFTVDVDDFVNAYIGGACDNIGSWNCMAGYGVSFGLKHPLNVSKAATGRMTHNVGEIEAAIDAIEIAERNGIHKLCLHTSSEFLLSAVTSWIFHWKNNGWRNQAGKVVQNRKELEQLNKLLNDSDVTVKWKNIKNEQGASKIIREAKALAQIGMEEYLVSHPSKENSMSAMDFDYFF